MIELVITLDSADTVLTSRTIHCCFRCCAQFWCTGCYGRCSMCCHKRDLPTLINMQGNCMMEAIGWLHCGLLCVHISR